MTRVELPKARIIGGMEWATAGVLGSSWYKMCGTVVAVNLLVRVLFGTIYKYFSRSLLGRVIIKKHRSLTARTIAFYDVPCICLDSSDGIGCRFVTYTSSWLLMLLALSPRVISSPQLLAAFHNQKLR